jgi:DNA-binding transcriptional regulator YdaS (Cro superfamily)
MTALDEAIKLAGGLTALGKKIGSKPQVVSNWRTRGIPPERCADIESATGGRITRQQLRPDIFGRPTPARKQAA